MKRIGFIDWYLDEWHANNYPAWIRDPSRNTAPDGSKRFEITLAYAAVDKPGGLSTDAWCEKFGVERASSIEALVANCDCVVVLSPDHPEKHEALAAVALASGKPVYIDKTFAPDKASAVRMFERAKAHGTPMYSTSALRYAREFHSVRDAGLEPDGISLVSTRGPGIIDNYGIHQVEMIQTLMGTGTRRVLMQGPAETPTFLFQKDGGRTAVVQHLPWSGFSVLVHGTPGDAGRGTTPAHEPAGMAFDVVQDFWGPFADELLRFFETGVATVPEEETIEAVAMIEAGAKAARQPGTWIEV